MVNKEVLQQMGFRLGTGFKSEVWYHDSDFWVYFLEGYESEYSFEFESSGSMEDFFDAFLKNMENNIMDSARVSF